MMLHSANHFHFMTFRSPRGILLCAALMFALAGCKAENNDDSAAPPEDAIDTGNPITDNDNDDEDGNSDDDGDDDHDDDIPEDDEDSEAPDEDLIASCGTGERFLPLVNDLADLGLRVRVRSGRHGDRCRHCSVRNDDAVIENNLLSSARMMTPAGTSSSVYITVRMPHVGHGSEMAGFMVSAPVGLMASDLLERIDLAVIRDEETVERGEYGENRFHVFETGDSVRYLVMMETREGFDSMRIRLRGSAETENSLDVYAACVDRYGW